MGRIPANKGQRYESDVLSMSEVSKLMSACNGGLTGARNRALIVVMYRAGLRVSEALNLNVGDFRLVEHNGSMMNAIKVRKGKGGKSRVVGIDDGAMDVIREWLSLRSSRAGMNGRFTRERFIKAGPIFCSLEGNRLDSSYVRKVLPRLAAMAGIDRRVHPHMLRHSHAFELAMESVPMNVIQNQLGHASLKTTSVYVNHLGDAQVISAVASREAFVG
jgi:site-specific recombinase XerD